jgi:hypothetical protein
MGLFFALTARQALEWVAPAEHGIAAGVNNALRQVGAVLGVAVLASVFAANGDYTGAVQFVAGLRAALWVGAAVVAVAFVADLLVPRPVRPDPVVGSSMSV